MGNRIELLNHVQGLPREPPRAVADLDAEIRAFTQNLPATGRPTTVAVLDSGIGRHWYLADRTIPVGGAGGGDEWWDLSSPVLPREIGHGGAVAGVVRQFAARATILSRRVIDRDGASHDDVLARAIRDLIKYSPDVLNLSLGPGRHPDGSITATPRTAAAIAALQGACGTIVVVAAGYKNDNWPQAELTEPGERTVIVGATEPDGNMATFSDDRDVRIWARGRGVLVPFLYWNGLVRLGETDDDDETAQPDTAGTEDEPTPMRFAGWAEWTGTSFAAPAVAGAVADAIGQNPGTYDHRERRLAGLQAVLDAAVVDSYQRRVLSARSSLNTFYSDPTR